VGRRVQPSLRNLNACGQPAREHHKHAGAENFFDLSVGESPWFTGGSAALGLQIATALARWAPALRSRARKPDELQEAVAHPGPARIEAQTIAAARSFADPVRLLRASSTTVIRPSRRPRHPGQTMREPPGARRPKVIRRMPAQRVMTLNVDAMFFLSQEVARRSLIPPARARSSNMASIADSAAVLD